MSEEFETLLYAALEDEFYGGEAGIPGTRLDKPVIEFVNTLEAQLSEARDENVKLKTDLEQMNNYADEMHQSVLDWELQLAEAKARLAEFEEGYDPKVKLPKDRQTVIAKEVRDDQPIYWDVEFLNGDDGNLWVNWAFAEPSNTADIVRWFPLPGSKEEE